MSNGTNWCYLQKPKLSRKLKKKRYRQIISNLIVSDTSEIKISLMTILWLLIKAYCDSSYGVLHKQYSSSVVVSCCRLQSGQV